MLWTTYSKYIVNIICTLPFVFCLAGVTMKGGSLGVAAVKVMEGRRTLFALEFCTV